MDATSGAVNAANRIGFDETAGVVILSRFDGHDAADQTVQRHRHGA